MEVRSSVGSTNLEVDLEITLGLMQTGIWCGLEIDNPIENVLEELQRLTEDPKIAKYVPAGEEVLLLTKTIIFY